LKQNSKISLHGCLIMYQTQSP